MSETSASKKWGGNSLAVKHHAFTAKGLDSVPGRGTRIPQAAQHGQKKKKNWGKKFGHKQFNILLMDKRSPMKIFIYSSSKMEGKRLKQ